MGCSGSKTSVPERRVQFSEENEDDGQGFDGVSANSRTGAHDDFPREMRSAPTLNRVIVFKSALADSSDEEDVDNEVYSSEEEENSSIDHNSVRSLSNDIVSIPDLSLDEKRETPLQFHWMHDMPRSPEESHRKRLNSAAAEAEKQRLDALEELKRPPAVPAQRRPTLGPARSLKELLDHSPPPMDKLVFVNFNNLKYDLQNRRPRTAFPRNPEDEDLGEAILENPSFSRPDTFMVFVSHEWIGEVLPEAEDGCKGRKCDTEYGDKYRLLMKAIETAWETLAPGMVNCYVWCDHFCLNQDKDTGAYTGVSLLNLNICNIMRLCDIMLTPIVDIGGYNSWDYPTPSPSAEQAGAALAGREGVDWFAEYKSEAFQGISSPFLPHSLSTDTTDSFDKLSLPLSEGGGGNMSPCSNDSTPIAGTGALGAPSKDDVHDADDAGTEHKASSSSVDDHTHTHARRRTKDSGYLRRAWCRLEMLCNAAVPLLDEWIKYGIMSKEEQDGIKQAKVEHEDKVVEKRHEAFRGSLLSAARHGIRPHYIYGTKEEMTSHGPILLPRYSKKLSEELHAINGVCTDEAVDKTLIDAILKQIESTVQPLVDGGGSMAWWRKEMYSGGRNADGLKHGFGTYVWPDNSSYAGPWAFDMANGKGGMLRLANSDTVEGAFKDGKPSGFCTYSSLIGDVYFGELNHKLEKHGQGKMQYANGDAYEGYWADNMRHHKGRFTYMEGDQFTGFFKNNKMNGYGTWKYVSEPYLPVLLFLYLSYPCPSLSLSVFL